MLSEVVNGKVFPRLYGDIPIRYQPSLGQYTGVAPTQQVRSGEHVCFSRDEVEYSCASSMSLRSPYCN